jgi:integrase
VTPRKPPARVGQSHSRSRPHLTPMQFYRILDMLPERWRPYFVILALTGLPVAELAVLRPADLDHDARAIRIKDSRTPSGVRTVCVAEQFWPYVLASVPVPVTHWYLRDHWNAAVDRAGLKEVSVTALSRLRSKLLAEADADSRGIRLLLADLGGEPSVQMAWDRRTREEARLLAQLLPALALTEDEGRRMLVRRVPD